MERLTERCSNGQALVKGCGENCKHEFFYCYTEDCPTKNKLIDKLAEYEDLEEQGLLLRLPCKVGTPYWTLETQYWIDEEKCQGCLNYYDYDIETFCDIDEDYPSCMQVIEKVFLNNLEIVSIMANFGNTVFLTREEAEKALEKMKGGADETVL